jgi:hypothetical protein
MSLATITQLQTALSRGARANLFEIEIGFPDLSTVDVAGTNPAAGAAEKVRLMCKAAQVPGFTVGTIEVPFKAGRRIKIPGDRTFADWSITVINDEDHTLRRAFTSWVNLISNSNYNAATKSPTTVAYYKDILVKQLNQKNEVTRTYKLNDAYPTDVGALDLSFDSTDTISEFTVNFQYHYLQAASGVSTIGSTTEV